MTDDRRKEPLYDPILSAGRYQRSAFGRAVSPLEALVVCEPGNEPEESVLEQLSLRDAVADALDELDEDDRWLFDMLLVVHLSLRFVGLVIGMPKTTVARQRDRIIAGLQQRLLTNPVVRERFAEASLGWVGTPQRSRK